MVLSATASGQFQPDSTLYPFASHYFETSHGKMHYLDEGNGPVIVLIHGTPTWSILYRNYVKSLSKNYRCIVPDHIGFGLSDRPLDFSGSPKAHCQNLEALIQHLGLDSFDLVVHDFGGPIGLGYAIAHPEKVKKIVVHNTWLWETAADKSARRVDKLINSWLGRWLYLKFNFSPRVLLKKGFDDPKKLSKNLHQHYLGVFPTPHSRKALLQLAEHLVGSSDWYGSLWSQLHLLEHKQWLFIWGSKDQFLGEEYLNRWENRLPKAQVERLPVGHFVQEEASTESLQIIRDFLIR